MKAKAIIVLGVLLLLSACSNSSAPPTPPQPVSPTPTIVQSDSLECPPGEGGVSGSADFVPGAPGEKGEPIDIALQDMKASLPGDVFAYVKRLPAPHNAEVALLRDGKVVATFSYFRTEDGGWLRNTYSACSSANKSI